MLCTAVLLQILCDFLACLFLEYMSTYGREDRLTFRLSYSPMEDHETKRQRGPALTWWVHVLCNTQLQGSDRGQASVEFSASNCLGIFDDSNAKTMTDEC